MVLDDVLDEIEVAAGDLAIQAPSIRTAKGKAYEVWILLEIVVRLVRQGVSVLPLDHTDNLEPVFRVRGAPGKMPWAGSKHGNEPCHFAFGRGGRWFELHLGLQHRGVSTATHELDISVLPIAEGQACRAFAAAPYSGSVQDGLELKAYDEKHKLDHAIPRAIIGIAVDLDPSWAMDAIVIKTPGGAERQFHRQDRTRFAILTSTKLHDSSEALLEHHHVGAHPDVLPGLNEAAIDEVVAGLLRLLPRRGAPHSPPPRPPPVVPRGRKLRVEL